MFLLHLFAAWVYGHLIEYILHKYAHRYGKRGNILSSHWKLHHRNARHFNMSDGHMWRENVVVAGLLVIHLPLLVATPWFYWGLVLSSMSYSYHHTRAHSDHKWAIAHLPWHYTHHMGRNQNANWGVRSDWVDRLVGTRVDLAGN